MQTRSIPLLLMPWLFTLSGHHKPRLSLYQRLVPPVFLESYLNNLCQTNVKLWYMTIYVSFFEMVQPVNKILCVEGNSKIFLPPFAANMSIIRPGVQTMISVPRRSSAICSEMPVPPYTQTVCRPRTLVNFLHSLLIWRASSRVGVRMTPEREQNALDFFPTNSWKAPHGSHVLRSRSDQSLTSVILH